MGSQNELNWLKEALKPQCGMEAKRASIHFALDICGEGNQRLILSI
jgi:hypothetical protein